MRTVRALLLVLLLVVGFALPASAHTSHGRAVNYDTVYAYYQANGRSYALAPDWDAPHTHDVSTITVASTHKLRYTLCRDSSGCADSRTTTCGADISVSNEMRVWIWDYYRSSTCL